MMRCYFVVILVVSLIPILWSCRNKLDPGNISDSIEQHQPFVVAKSESVPREISSVSEELLLEQAASTNRFAVEMYKNLIKEDSGNLFFSPYSITAALAMTGAGAPDSSQTRKQILNALQVTLKDDSFDMTINGLDYSLMEYAKQTEGITLKIVNSTWMQTGWDFRVEYLDHLSRFYGAGVNLLDFFNKPEDCRNIINNWVAEQTNQKIKSLLPQGSITQNTMLVLTNAIYFLGDWLYAFKPEYTEDRDFMLLNDTPVQVPLMRFDEPHKKVKMLYSRQGEVRALNFPYKGDRIVMTVFLPDQGKFLEFENNLNVEKINQLISDLDSTELLVALPKFEFTWGTSSLVEPLKKLGMVDAFVPGVANFSKIDGTRNLVVSDILHKAFISVDEKGTEAAAATAVVFVRTSIEPEQPEFVVNRPFVFVIRDKESGIILFMGRVLNPLVKE